MFNRKLTFKVYLNQVSKLEKAPIKAIKRAQYLYFLGNFKQKIYKIIYLVLLYYFYYLFYLLINC